MSATTSSAPAGSLAHLRSNLELTVAEWRHVTRKGAVEKSRTRLAKSKSDSVPQE